MAYRANIGGKEDITGLGWLTRLTGGKWFIVIGDKKGEEFDGVGDPVFSPDDKDVACGAQKGRKLWWKVMKIAEER
ncbi:MAG: hypothetical protein AB1630_08880 [bacterium]